MSIVEMPHLRESLAAQSEGLVPHPLHEERAALAREVRDRLNIACYLEGLAEGIAAQGDINCAGRLWEAAETLREISEVSLPPRAPVHELPYGDARAVLSAKPSFCLPAGLTERELVVLRLVAQGMTNHQIADHLIISLHTVNAHVRSIFNKVEVNSRCALTRYAVERRLL
jgi:DNA-binding CsgD family transcriptional regulator